MRTAIRAEVFAMIPQDPIILLSYVNTKLRDQYPTLDDLCGGLDIEQEELVRKLETVNYRYSAEHNQFI